MTTADPTERDEPYRERRQDRGQNPLSRPPDRQLARPGEDPAERDQPPEAGDEQGQRDAGSEEPEIHQRAPGRRASPPDQDQVDQHRHRDEPGRNGRVPRGRQQRNPQEHQPEPRRGDGREVAPQHEQVDRGQQRSVRQRGRCGQHAAEQHTAERRRAQRGTDPPTCRRARGPKSGEHEAVEPTPQITALLQSATYLLVSRAHPTFIRPRSSRRRHSWEAVRRASPSTRRIRGARRPSRNRPSARFP